MTLYIRVQELREAKGWSQAELARRAKVRPNTLVDFERGTAKRIGLDVLEKVANALDVDPGFLITRKPPKGRGK
jgi:transcriptional regulator with XRE-family HTH domain